VSPTKCKWCKGEIHRGTEWSKAIFEYRLPKEWPDKPDLAGQLVTVGWDQDFKEPPKGASLISASHYKHFKVAVKRESRGGDAVTGRGMGSIPTAYDIGKLTANKDELALLGLTEEQARSLNTRELSERVAAQRVQAREAGTGVQDWKLQEKLRAEKNGGPSSHTHAARLEDFQLEAHLQYSHGIVPMASAGSRHQQHSEAHARAAQQATQQSRAQDPGRSGEVESKMQWPGGETVTSEVGELPVPTSD
jgi:hypothetical protein